MVFDVKGLGLNLDIQSKQFFKAPEIPLLYSGVDIIIPEDCNGCGLCLPVCPMDCIEKAPTDETSLERLDKKSHYAKRYQNHKTRKEHRKQNKQQQYRQAKKPQGDRASQLQARMAEIQAAVQRQKRKNESIKTT